MRIALIASPFISVPPTRYGGTELFIAQLAEGLKTLGLDVVVYANGESRVSTEVRALYDRDQWPIEGELYANLKTVAPEERHVIASAYDDPEFYKDKARVLPEDKRNSPMLWTRSWGQGRVFVTALGHDVKALQNPGFRTTIVRGAEWAATAAVAVLSGSN